MRILSVNHFQISLFFTQLFFAIVSGMEQAPDGGTKDP